MAYDEKLEKRISGLISKRKDFHSQKMFGGVGYLMRGNMCVAVWKDHLICRLGPEMASKSLRQKGAKPFDITGRAMKGWVMIAPEGMRTEASLKKWVSFAVDFVSTLPRK